MNTGKTKYTNYNTDQQFEIKTIAYIYIYMGRKDNLSKV